MMPWLPWVRLPVLFLFLLLLAPASGASAQTSTVPGELTAYSTIYSIGLEWHILNDTDHDARAQVEYRAAAGDWREGGALLRVDYGERNMLAGSLLFLTPDTEYVVRVSLLDPDGGGAAREVRVRTRRVPVSPSGGRVFHVVPGSGGGDGSPGAPFRGVDAAQAAARPGDIFLLHAGNYGGRVVFQTPGTAGSYIAWKAAGDGEVAMAGIDILASHLWLEGLTVRNQYYATRTGGAPTDVVLIRSTFLNNHYSVFLSSGGSDWYIADNTIVGDTPLSSESFAGEGIELNLTSGHTVAHNSITTTADGISYPGTNVDMFGNDIFDTSDDGIELDFGRANVRVWGNRIHNPHHNGISFQPQGGGPWYIVRNQIAGGDEAPLKFRTTDRFVLLHNTIVNWGGYMFCCSSSHLLRAYARNNLWISASGGQMWAFDSTYRDWRTDLDYDGFDWGTGAYPFWYDGVIYYDVGAFAAATGLVPNGIRVYRESCFADFRMPGPTPTPVPPHVMALQPSCNAVDAGAVLPNVNDGFAGSAPDLGAHEYGHPAALYGPRSADRAPTVALTAPAPDTTLSEPATVALSAVAADSDGSVRRVDFYAGGSLLGSDSTSPYSLTWSDVAAGTYSLSARATDDAGNVAASGAVTLTVTGGAAPPPPASSPLPDGWAQQDIGAVAVAGAAGASGGVWSVSASGPDVWGSADAFRFVYRALTGDGTITARVSTLQNTHAWAKAGVMIRESLTPGSPHAFMLVTPAGGNGLAFQRRVAAGGGTTHTSGGTGAAPVWVRVTRSGHTVSAFRSSDGMGWTMVGSETMALSATVYVGLALTSHSATLGTATFEHVAVTGAAASPSSGLPAGWTNRDVGAAGVAGRVTVSGGTWVMEASGADVWGSADAFHYAYRSLTGDGTIVARVTALQRTHMWAKAGVMIRAGLDPGAAHAFMLVTPEAGAGLAFQRRLAAGGATTHTSGGGGTAPVWVRLSRTGSTVTAWHSPDGATWTEVGRDTVALGTTVYVGVGATSHDNGVTASATFDNILVTEGDSAGWNSRDIGSVGAAGAAAFDGRAGTVSGSGADIWGGRDAFRYAYASARGDFAIVARVVAVDDVDLWTKAGVMIRASLSSDSPHVSLFATPTAIKGVAFQRRLTAGGASVHTPGASVAPTVWLRLWRQGGAVYAAYRRSSGDAWTTIAAESGAALPDMVFVGLAVTSHDDGAIATATFDNVAIGPVP